MTVQGTPLLEVEDGFRAIIVPLLEALTPAIPFSNNDLLPNTKMPYVTLGETRAYDDEEASTKDKVAYKCFVEVECWSDSGDKTQAGELLNSISAALLAGVTSAVAVTGYNAWTPVKLRQCSLMRSEHPEAGFGGYAYLGLASFEIRISELEER